MTLLITIFAAVAATLIWYTKPGLRDLKIGVLCWMFWGASLMWLGDAIFGYIEDGAAFFEPEAAKMLNDAYLGLSVVALGMILWLAILLIKDPKGVVKASLRKKAEE